MTYPAAILPQLDLGQLESVATTPLERELLRRLEELRVELELLGLDADDLEDSLIEAKDNAIEKYREEYKVEAYKQFFDDIVEQCNWPCAEPDDGNLQQAISRDLERGQVIAEMLRELVKNGAINTETWDVAPHEITVEITNAWPLLDPED